MQRLFAAFFALLPLPLILVACRTPPPVVAPAAAHGHGVEVFQTWDELPPDLRNLAPSLFDTRMVVRLTVGAGCLADGDRACPGGGERLWGEEYDRHCRSGEMYRHPLRIISRVEDLQFSQGVEEKMTPAEGEDGAQPGLELVGGAVICAPRPGGAARAMLYEQHLFAVPRIAGPITMRANTYATDYCMCGG